MIIIAKLAYVIFPTIFSYRHLWQPETAESESQPYRQQFHRGLCIYFYFPMTMHPNTHGLNQPTLYLLKKRRIDLEVWRLWIWEIHFLNGSRLLRIIEFIEENSNSPACKQISQLNLIVDLSVRQLSTTMYTVYTNEQWVSVA